tara:strand:- start:27079 stop:27351 length:273 start_codon:yes stop_codon:yes gene_type:complete
MNMREKIALAILNSDRLAAGLEPAASRENIPGSDGYLRNARAALDALETPTPEMVEASEKMLFEQGYCIDCGVEDIWSAMIRAAVAEGER